MVFNKKKQVLQLLISITLLSNTSFGQNVTSPYSILGIGDIETKDFGRYFGLGSTSLALRDGNTFNFANPASLTALDSKIMNFDFMMRGRVSRFLSSSTDTFTSPSKDYAVRRISIAYKPQKRWAFAFGLKPYSTVNYLLNDSTKLADNTSQLNKSADGNGGIYQVFLSNGFALTKNFSVGLTTSVLFGSLETNTTYTSSNIGLDITRNEYNALHALLFTGGLQYAGKINKSFTQQIGVTVSNKAKLTGEWSTEYITSDSTITTEVDNSKHITLPLQIGLGYALIFNDKLTLTADYNLYKWQKQKVDYTNSYIDKGYRFSGGLQYSFKNRSGLQTIEKYYLQAGFSYEKTYLNIRNKPLNDYAYSFGFGNRVSRVLSYNLGLEIGRKGSLNYNQIKENYTQFVIGISLKDLWFNAARYGRYD